MRWSGVVALVLLLPCPAAARPLLSFELEPSAGLGYESNLYLETSALLTDGEARGGGFVELAAQLVGTWGSQSSHHLTLGYEATFQQYFADGSNEESLFDHLLFLRYQSAPWAAFRLVLTGAGDQLRLREQGGQGWLGGYLGVQALRGLGASLQAMVGYFLDYTSFGEASSAQWQLAHWLQAEMTWWVWTGLSLAPGYAFSVGRAEPAAMDSTLHQAGLSLTWQLLWAKVALELGYSFGILERSGAVTRTNPTGKPLPSKEEQRTDQLHRTVLELRYDVSPAWTLFVRHAALLGQSNLDEDYSRQTVLAGVSFRLEGSTASPARTEEQEEQEEGMLRLRYQAPRARAVSVVGTFNDWDPARHPLHRQGDNWMLSLRLPPGRQQYMLWVDGQLRPPPGCAQWFPDGFGERNCVIMVKEK